MRFVEHTEGDTRLLVPPESLAVDPPPTSPVFFNPAASINRDITVAVTSATEGTTFCDSMCGVGARGLRVAKEVDRLETVCLVDFNEAALGAAKQASLLNGVERKCEFSNSETSSFLYSRYGRDQRFDYVDLDPFGTPIRQMQASISATSDGGILSVTATDTAVLCGVYPDVSKRRYGSTSLNNRFHHETGARILFSALAKEAAKMEAGILPLAAHATRHYIRVYARIMGEATKADESLDLLGFVVWCRACGHADTSREPEENCGSCGKKAKVAGPLWLGDITDQSALKAASENARKRSFAPASRILESLDGVDQFPPWSFSIEEACSALRVASVSEAGVYQALRNSGHRAMRTPFEKLGIKTDATHGEFTSAVKTSVKTGPTTPKVPRPPGSD